MVRSGANTVKDYYTLFCLVSYIEDGIAMPCSITPHTAFQNRCASHPRALVSSCKTKTLVADVLCPHSSTVLA